MSMCKHVSSCMVVYNVMMQNLWAGVPTADCLTPSHLPECITDVYRR